MAEIDGDAEPVVAGVLDGLHLAQAHRDLEARAAADRGLGRARPAAAGLPQEVGDLLLQARQAHGGILGGGDRHIKTLILNVDTLFRCKSDLRPIHKSFYRHGSSRMVCLRRAGSLFIPAARRQGAACGVRPGGLRVDKA